MSNSINILFQSNESYAPYMGVSILSLLENNKEIDEITIYAICTDVSDKNKDRLRRTVEAYGRNIIFLDASKLKNENSDMSEYEYSGFRVNKNSYFKMFVAEMVPELHGRLLYIDCDTVIEGSISELVDFDMQGYAIGMVQDSLVGGEKVCIGLENSDRYYNSGVILFDIDKWRTNNGSERFLNHMKSHTYGTVDQDAINVEFKSEIITLPIKYNLQSVHLVTKPELFFKVCKHKEAFYSFEEVSEASDNPVIVHFLRFLGEHAWDRGTLHPGRELYDKYCNMSEWRGEARTESKAGIVFAIEKIMFRILPRALFFRIFYFFHKNMIKRSSK